eukprot:scaffold108065_cov44-Prasinocladus_malaysianus.AAC.1
MEAYLFNGDHPSSVAPEARGVACLHLLSHRETGSVERPMLQHQRFNVAWRIHNLYGNGGLEEKARE